MRCVIDGCDIRPAEELGGKINGLSDLVPCGFSIPPWFVVTADAFYQSLSADRAAEFASVAVGDGPPEWLSEIRLADSVLAELRFALRRLSPSGEPVAVRSSAPGEDGLRHSFAGQLDSFLNVYPDDVPSRIIAVWRSAFGERVRAYSRSHGAPPPRPPAVLIQQMVHAEVSGVAFSRDPRANDSSTSIVTAVYGLSVPLVDGQVDADTYEVDQNDQIVSEVIVDKLTAMEACPDRTGLARKVILPDRINRPALSTQQVLQIAKMARRAADCRQMPQDIEWALASGELYLLQSRPITSKRFDSKESAVSIWDNSNISESYSGVVTPLTFSFIRHVYEHVYREFCRVLKVSPSRLEAHDSIFRNMLGMIQGRVYYNLIHWYRTLTLLPGFRANYRFMEQMMGVREGLPVEIVKELEAATSFTRLKDRLDFGKSLMALVWGHVTLCWRVTKFMGRLENALAVVPGADTDPSLEELASAYHELERRLIRHWDTPLLTDFLAMVFYGVLGKLTLRWCGDESGGLRNALLQNSDGMISTEPARQVVRLAELAAMNPAVIDALERQDSQAMDKFLQEPSEFARCYHGYLERFANRFPGELKLESLPLDQEPTSLWGAIAQAARRRKDPDRSHAADLADNKTARVNQALRGHPLRSVVFQWVLRHARNRIRDRENLRFERTRLFGEVRGIFTAVGKRLFERDALVQPRDIFFLEVDEVWGFIEGTSTCNDLKGLVRVRRSEYEKQLSASPPPRRLETRGCVALSTWRQASLSVDGGEQRQGLGSSPGIVRGTVRVIDDPKADRLRSGEILVAMRTDPGWAMIFPSASGILVECGSLLSHAAVVSRELGIPAVVSIPGLTRWLKSGDCVEFDGSTGLVSRVQVASPEGDVNA